MFIAPRHRQQCAELFSGRPDAKQNHMRPLNLQHCAVHIWVGVLGKLPCGLTELQRHTANDRAVMYDTSTHMLTMSDAYVGAPTNAEVKIPWFH